MSVVHENLKRDEDDSDRWFLKVNNLIHGPLTLVDLCKWARQGRVAAGNELSHDKKSWFPAESVKSLKMDCVVGLSNGKKFGPVNIEAVPHLMNEGIIDSDATLLNTKSGDRIDASALLDPQRRDQIISEAQAAVPRNSKDDQGMSSVDSKELAQKNERIKDLEKQIAKSELAVKKNDALLADAEAQEHETSKDSDHKITSLETKIEGLETNLAQEKERAQKLADNPPASPPSKSDGGAVNEKLVKELESEVKSLEQKIVGLEIELKQEKARKTHAATQPPKSEPGGSSERLAKEFEELKQRASIKEKEMISKISELKKQSKSMEWYFRSKSGTEFGPISLFELYDWAAQCRIGPNHEVSPDKQRWYMARNIPELKMEWTAPLVDGSFYGPVNKLAIHHLMNEGVVAYDAELVNYSTGKTVLASSLLTPEVNALLAQNSRLIEELKRERHST